MLNLVKLNKRFLKPPATVFDYAYINKKVAPTRAGTKRENWARFGSQRSRVQVQEIVPTFEEYKLEYEAEKNWWPNRRELNAQINKIHEDKVKFDKKIQEEMEKKLKKQKTYEQQIEKAKVEAAKAEEKERLRIKGEMALFDALGYKPEAGTADAKLKAVKNALKSMAAGKSQMPGKKR